MRLHQGFVLSVSQAVQWSWWRPYLLVLQEWKMDERGSVGDNVRAETSLEEGLRGLLLPLWIWKRSKKETKKKKQLLLLSVPPIWKPNDDNVRERSRSTWHQEKPNFTGDIQFNERCIIEKTHLILKLVFQFII